MARPSRTDPAARTGPSRGGLHVRVHAGGGFARDTHGPALTRLDPRCRTLGDRPRTSPPDVVEEERPDDCRDRDAEDRPAYAADLRPDEDGAKDDDRMDADRLLHQAWLKDV